METYTDLKDDFYYYVHQKRAILVKLDSLLDHGKSFSAD